MGMNQQNGKKRGMNPASVPCKSLGERMRQGSTYKATITTGLVKAMKQGSLGTSQKQGYAFVGSRMKQGSK